jgi:hypothetical protein
MSATLITKFSKTDAYETLIYELNQVKQGALEKMKEYTDKVQDLFAKIIRILKKQRHAEGIAIFTGMDLLAFKYYVIELLPKIKQEVKYEEAKDFLKQLVLLRKKKIIWKILQGLY